VAIGDVAGSDGSGAGNIATSSTAIGRNAKWTASNQIVLGTASETVYMKGNADVDGALNIDGIITNTVAQPASGDSSTKVPTTAWVQGAITAGGGAGSLSATLLVGNTAGSTDIDMTNNDITNCDTVNFVKGTNVMSVGIGGVGNGVFTNVNIGNFTIPITASSATGGNVAIGDGPLFSLTTGDNNVAIGSNALQNNLIGGSNVAIGPTSLFNSTGSYNFGLGNRALEDLITGDRNVGIGAETGNFTIGSNNTLIGDGADCGNSLTFATAIGSGAVCSTSDTIVLGKTSGNVNCPNTLSVAGIITNTVAQPASNDSSTKVPTTAWVQTAIGTVNPQTWGLTTGNIANAGGQLVNGSRSVSYNYSAFFITPVQMGAVARFEFTYSVYGVKSASSGDYTLASIDQCGGASFPQVNNPNTTTFFDVNIGFQAPVTQHSNPYLTVIQTTSNYWNTTQTYYPKNAPTTPYTFKPLEFTYNALQSSPKTLTFTFGFPQNVSIGGNNALGDMSCGCASLRIVSSPPSTANEQGAYSSNTLGSASAGSWYFF